MKFSLFFMSLFFVLTSCQDTEFYGDNLSPGEQNDPDDQFVSYDDCKAEGLEHGTSEDVLFYLNEVVDFGGSCEEVKIQKICNDGDIHFEKDGEKIEIANYFENCSIKEALNCGDVEHGEVVLREKYKNSSVAFGGICEKETQKAFCENGKLSEFSGSFEHDNCSVGGPASCGDIAHGESDLRVMFESSSVAFGESCNKENQKRICENGKLSDWSGSFSSEKCEVKGPADCGSLAHGESESRFRFLGDSVPYNGRCAREEQKRSCSNGVLSAWSGSYKFEKCDVQGPANCGNLAHGDSEARVMFESSSVAFGESCQKEDQKRSCNNGKLSDWSGSFSSEKCEEKGPADCGSLAHGDSESRIMFEKSSVAFGGSCKKEEQKRNCKNGNLSDWSGSFSSEKCEVKDPSDCGSLAHGEKEYRKMFEVSAVAYGEACKAEKQERVCNNGKLSDFSGSFVHKDCEIKDPLNCGDIAHNDSEVRYLYEEALVAYGAGGCKKESQKRRCYNGEFGEWSGSFEHEKCEIGKPKNCGAIAHGQSDYREMFEKSSVAYGEVCKAEKQERICKNGEFSDFSGSFKEEKCIVGNPKDCGDIAHGEKEYRKMFESSSVAYGEVCKAEKQERICKNGEFSDFSGSFKEEKCIVGNPKDCGDIAHGEKEYRKMFESSSVAYGEVCKAEKQERICKNGEFSDFNGSFKEEKCVEGKPKDCGDIAHGKYETRKRFEASSVVFGEICKAEEQRRTCLNGNLSDWSGSYEHEKCVAPRPKNCEYQGVVVKHNAKAKRFRFRDSNVPEGETCEYEAQYAKCINGELGDFDGSYEEEECVVDNDDCKKGKILTISIDKDGDGVADTEPVEIISYKGAYSSADNYNYYSWSAHPIIGPNPEGYKSHAYLYEGSDGLSLQFYFNKDKIAGEAYDGSPNSVVKLDILTEGNNGLDKVLLSDDRREFKDAGYLGAQKLYQGRFHYWYNTDGGAIGPFEGEDYRIIVKPIESYELIRRNGKLERQDAFNGATFFSADGTVVQLDDQNGSFHSYIIEYKEDKTCEEHEGPGFCENLIQNGSFEEDHGLTGDSWDVFKYVGAWSAEGEGASRDAPIEIQCGAAGPRATHGSCNAELDAHNFKGFAGSDGSLSQKIFLEKGQEYVLSFDYFARDAAHHSNGMYIKIGDEYIFKHESNARKWFRKVIKFVANRDGAQRIEFIGSPDKNNTLGINLDNIKLEEASCSLEKLQCKGDSGDVTANEGYSNNFKIIEAARCNSEDKKKHDFELACSILHKYGNGSYKHYLKYLYYKLVPNKEREIVQSYLDMGSENAKDFLHNCEKVLERGFYYDGRFYSSRD